MGYFVLSDGDGSSLVYSWSAAQEALKGRADRSCRSFTSREEAIRFKGGLRHAAPPREGEQVVYVDGAAHHGQRATAAAFFGPGDARNQVWELTDPPFTSPRAELLAAIMAAEICSEPAVILSDCEFVCRAYRERFPSRWANQDLMRRLSRACESSGCRIRRIPGHSGDKGNDAAHALCNGALGAART